MWCYPHINIFPARIWAMCVLYFRVTSDDWNKGRLYFTRIGQEHPLPAQWFVSPTKRERLWWENEGKTLPFCWCYCVTLDSRHLSFCCKKVDNVPVMDLIGGRVLRLRFCCSQSMNMVVLEGEKQILMLEQSLCSPGFVKSGLLCVNGTLKEKWFRQIR